jgi:gas vesicle protein
MNNENERTAAEIERDIERTRERVTQDIDALGERLSPDSLKQQAKDAIADKAHEVAANVGEQARQTGFRMAEFIRDNPLPVAAAGLGAVWLFTQRKRTEISGDRMARFAYTGPERRGPGMGRPPGNGIGRRLADRAGEVKDAVGGKAHAIAERAGDLGHDAAERIQDLGSTAKENPLVLMAGAAFFGLLLGLLVPESERERRLMGPTRDRLADRAQAVGERVKDAAVEAGREISDTVKQEIADRGPELKETLAGAAEAVREQVKESASGVVEEAKSAAKGPETGSGQQRLG